MSEHSIPINPGGTLRPEDILGRDPLIGRYWQILEQQSIALLAPRRVGKTSICRRMSAMPPTGFVTRWRDLEGLDTAHDFVRHLFSDCEDLLSDSQKLARRGRKALEAITSTVELKGFRVQLQPKEAGRVLDGLLADLDEMAGKQGVKIVLFWDEFTWFLSDLADKDRAAEATMLLDRLRAGRQQHPNLRMVLTGSIGLHLVLRRLGRDGYGNEPVNDVSKQVVPLLDPPAAEVLATALLTNIENVEGAQAQVAARLAEACEGHPFLMHGVAQRLKFRGAASATAIDEVLDELLQEESDPLELSHFLFRLDGYFDDQLRSAAVACLDLLAPQAAGQPFDQLLAGTRLERELVLRVVDVLRRDHYLLREGANLRFRMEFLRRYWCLERMLEVAQ